MLTERYKTWLTHIERGDRKQIRDRIEQSNREKGIKTKYTFEKLNKVLNTGEGNIRIIAIIDKYFTEKIKAKGEANEIKFLQGKD